MALAEHVVQLARRGGADAADVVIDSGVEFSVTVRRGRVEKLQEAASCGLGLRVFRGGRCAVTYTSDLTPAALARLVEQALDLAAVADPDPLADLPDPEAWALPQPTDLASFDPAVATVTVEQAIELARRCEQAAFDFDSRVTNSDGATYSSEHGSRVLVNSRGFAGSYTGTLCALSVEAICDDAEGKKRNDYWYTAARAFADLEPPELVGRRAAERAVRKLGARKARTQQVPVVWDPMVARAFVGHLARAFLGDALYRRATFLLDREGEQVASPLVTIVDDPTLPGRLRSRPFDGEGATARRNAVIVDGVFRQFLLDTYSARKTGRQTTASAVRSVSSTPAPGTTNLYLAAGPHTPREIIASVDNGLYLTDTMGFGWNITTGDFSQGAAGLWIERGELAYPVSEINVSGNLNAMLRDIDMVGNDLEFRSATAAPTFRMAKLMVSGL
ncbi:MAG: TldD/PmbA family protein [Chloroflexi bacterium]|nr:TldD/PmbA family protein [Chloroflexota bacterium]